jgi:crotonobetainyl-CoA:carnitine CoA-transferase CaiB-like acyl-CoA transferase
MTNAALEELLTIRGHDDTHRPHITGADPVYCTHYKVAQTGAAVLGAIGLAVSDIWEMKTGRRQTCSIDARAAAAALQSFAHLQRRDETGQYKVLGNSPAADRNYQITQPFPTRDGRWFLPHFGIKHLKERVLGVLECDDDPAGVARAIARWDAAALEDAIAEVRACGGVVRSPDEWLAHPHGAALAARPIVEIDKLGDSAPEPFSADGATLHGIRVLDLTRILAGPVAARTCAEHGADVLMVAARRTPQIKNFVIDLSHGKRSCFLDLEDTSESRQLAELAAGADVFSQGYRPGALAARGFGAEQLAQIRPGIIYATISCYGQAGPFASRAGWEQVAQSVTGICADSGKAQPALLPVPACDYLTGYLGAYGILLALARRAREGGSYHVNVSLCQSAMLLNRQGRVSYPSENMGLSASEALALQMESETSYGALRHLAPVLSFSETQPGWDRPSPKLGAHAPMWLS